MRTKQIIATGIVGGLAIAGIGLSTSASATGCHYYGNCPTTTTTEKPTTTTTTEKPTTTTTEVVTTTTEVTPTTVTTVPNETTTTVPTSLIPPVSIEKELQDHTIGGTDPYNPGEETPLKISG